MKPLKLNRTTVRALSESEMSGAAGGTILTPPVTLGCPSRVLACNPSWVDRCPTRLCTSGDTSLPDPIP